MVSEHDRFGNPGFYLGQAVSDLGSSVSEMVMGVMAWQVYVATGCDADVALSYVKSIMLSDHGAEKPSAETTFEIISEAVARAGGSDDR